MMENVFRLREQTSNWKGQAQKRKQNLFEVIADKYPERDHTTP